MKYVEVNTLDDFNQLRYTVDGNKLTLLSSSFEDGFIILDYGALQAKIHGHWNESDKVKITNWLSLQSDELFNKLKQKRFIFGKDPTERIVSFEIKNDYAEIYKESEDGDVYVNTTPIRHWVLSSKKLDQSWLPLEGSQHFKYIKYWDNKEQFQQDRKRLYKFDTFSIWNEKEAAQVMYGFTHYKGMKVEDVSVLSFDIEASGLTHDENSYVYCISNTFRRNGVITKRLFSADEYETQGEMLADWCAFVRECNPATIIAHNGFGYDFPYLEHCANLSRMTLDLGRDGSELRFDERTSKFRKDGSQDYEYTRCYIYGREIVDTMFVAYHYDYSRKYESYGLKAIVKHEGLEKEGRQFYDASKINENWNILEEREKIKQYAADDSDDSLKLYDLMIPSFFYLANSVPKPFQMINYSATGSQLNAFLLRSYLQDGYSIPKADEPRPFQGAISMGLPGLYRNVLKWDIRAMYPSVIIEYSVHDEKKDPSRHFLKMLDYFTIQRVENKKKAKETNDNYYKALEQMGKIFCNSSYGLLAAKLNFNSPRNAELVTEKGRELLSGAILWATSKTKEEWQPKTEDAKDES